MNCKKYKFQIFASFILVTGNFISLSAQNTITLEQAIASALKNNYGIQLVQYEKQLSDLQNYAGNAGMLPTISATATYNTELTNSEQQYFSGDTRSATNAGSTLLDAGVYLNYTVFNGFGMFATKDKLEEIAALGELKLRQQMEETVFNLMMSWYQLVQLDHAKNVADSTIYLSNQRYQIAKSKESVGAASGLDVLQAFVDLNADSSAFINLELKIKNLKAEINQMMGSAPGNEFTFQDNINVDPSILIGDVKVKADQNNIDILLAQKDEQIVNLQVKEFKSYLYPTLDLTGGYGYLKSTSESGFVESNLSYGPSIGLTLNIPLFNGFTAARNLEGAGISQQMSQTQILQTQLWVDTYITTLYNQYTTSLYLIGIDKKNVEAARQNISIAIEKFNAGTITSVDLRAIQQTQIDAENNLLLETLNAKLAELQLKKLSGTLLAN